MKGLLTPSASLLFLFTAICAYAQPAAQQVLDAGTSQVVRLDPVTKQLKGTSSMPAETTFKWSQRSGPAGADIDDPTSLSTDVTLSRLGTYVFRLTGTNGQETKTADVRFEVIGDDDEERSSEITAYFGTVFDNFVAAEQRAYLNQNLPAVSGSTDSRLLFGFDATWRIVGNSRSDRQLWFFLETL